MPNADTFQYELDGQAVVTNDGIIAGRDIRSKAGLNPVSNYVLIELGDMSSRSIGLEEAINLTGVTLPVFRSFKSDRTFSLTINERGYEWGDTEISAADIRTIASIPDDHELILDSNRDRVIGDDDCVRLRPKGVERILSRAPEKVCIFVNTVEEYVQPGEISFSDLAKLAFPELEITPTTEFTVSYRKGQNDDPAGSLISGETVKVKKGMIFDVTATDKS